jgi:hypothetical protein
VAVQGAEIQPGALERIPARFPAPRTDLICLAISRGSPTRAVTSMLYVFPRPLPVEHSDEFADGERQVHHGMWAKAREVAERAGLDHREDLQHATRRSRR